MGNSLQSGSEAQGLDYSQGPGLPGGYEKSSHVQKLQRLRASAAVTACDLLDAVSLEEKESGPPTPRARAGLTHSSFQHAEQCNLCRRNREARPEELTPGCLPQELSRFPGFVVVFFFSYLSLNMSYNFILIQMVLTPSPTGQERKKQTGRAPLVRSLHAGMDRGPGAAPCPGGCGRLGRALRMSEQSQLLVDLLTNRKQTRTHS